MIFWKFFSTNQYSKGSKKNNQYKTKQVSVSKKYFQYKTVQFNKNTLMVNAVQFKSENWIDLYWNPENQISNFYFVIVHLTNAFLLMLWTSVFPHWWFCWWQINYFWCNSKRIYFFHLFFFPNFENNHWSGVIGDGVLLCLAGVDSRNCSIMYIVCQGEEVT